jgi:hypothetical protein
VVRLRDRLAWFETRRGAGGEGAAGAG